MASCSYIALLLLSASLCEAVRMNHKKRQARSSQTSISQSFLSQMQTGRPCALYPALERKFGSPVRLAGYETVRCLGRGEQGEAWLIKDMEAVLKVLYRTDQASAATAEHACKFAGHMHKRDPDHFVNCWKTGIEELNMKTDDSVLEGTYTFFTPMDCDICSGSRLYSNRTAGHDAATNRDYSCMEAQMFALTPQAKAVGGCAGAQGLWSSQCCGRSGDFRYTTPEAKNVRLHYSVDGLAAGDEVRDLMIPGPSEVFPKLQDGLNLLHEIGQVAGVMMTPISEDPSQFYYLDLHLGNVMVTSERKIKFIDYGATYMCCNHSFPNAKAKCGDLPACDPKEVHKYRSMTKAFLFMDLLEILMGGFGKPDWAFISQPEFGPILDYFTLPWVMHGLLGPQRKSVEKLTPADTMANNFDSAKESYKQDWHRLGDVATNMLRTGLEDMASNSEAWPSAAARFIKEALESLSHTR